MPNGKNVSINGNLFYALSEIFQTLNLIRVDELEKKIQRILLKLNTSLLNEWLTFINENKISVVLKQLEEI